MTTIFKPGIVKILSIFYKNRNNKIHLRKLSRETGMFGQSLMRYLKILEKEKILKSEKEANLKLYYLNKTKKVYSLLSFFDVEMIEKLPMLRKNGIKTYINNLTEPPIFAVVFGSTAKGTYKDDSDVDILLITLNKLNVKNAEKEADALNAIKISTFQMNYHDFLKELKFKKDYVIQSAIESGYPIINHINYYEVLDNERI